MIIDEDFEADPDRSGMLTRDSWRIGLAVELVNADLDGDSDFKAFIHELVHREGTRGDTSRWLPSARERDLRKKRKKSP